MNIEIFDNKKHEELSVGDVVKIETSISGVGYYLVTREPSKAVHKYRLRNMDGATYLNGVKTLQELTLQLISASFIKSFKVFPKEQYKMNLVKN